MYRIVPAKKNTVDVIHHDYLFKDWKSFYEVADILTMKLTGSYSLGIKTNEVEDINNFVNNAGRYEHIQTYIYVSDEVVEYMSMRNPKLKIQDKAKPYEEFLEIVKRNRRSSDSLLVYRTYLCGNGRSC